MIEHVLSVLIGLVIYDVIMTIVYKGDQEYDVPEYTDRD